MLSSRCNELTLKYMRMVAVSNVQKCLPSPCAGTSTGLERGAWRRDANILRQAKIEPARQKQAARTTKRSSHPYNRLRTLTNNLKDTAIALMHYSSSVEDLGVALATYDKRCDNTDDGLRSVRQRKLFILCRHVESGASSPMINPVNVRVTKSKSKRPP